MTFPVLPQWASDDVVDPISGQNNVVEPPLEKKLEGWFYKEAPPRQWMNWLGRQTYLCLLEIFGYGSARTTDGAGVELFTVDDAIITIDAIDRLNPANYLRAVGYKATGAAPVFVAGSIQSTGLTLGAGTIAGDQPVTGSADIIIRGTSSVIPTP